MPEGNPILDDAATAVEADSSAYKGAGMLQDANDLAAKVRGGDWTEGLVSLASAAYETREFLQDPIAKLTSMGFGWAIEHLAPFTWVLDELTGNPRQLALTVETWTGIADELDGAARDLHDRYTRDTAGWAGPAVAQYRLFCADRVDLYRAAAATAQATADNVDQCRSILSAVREIVRGLVTDAAGQVVSILCRYPPPATPAAFGEISRTIANTGNAMRQWLDKLQRAFANAGRLMADGDRLFADLRRALAHANELGRMSTSARRGLDLLVNAFTGAGAAAKRAVKDVAGTMPEQLVEKIAIETGKESVNAAAREAREPERPGDASRLYDGPGPYRVSGTL